jgi:hypothetical protein
MPIPRPAPTGLLPPFLGTDPSRRDRTSPYRATTEELVERYATSAVRIRLLVGFLAFRAELRRAGFSDGFQWIDGSFVEVLPREPNDLDVVTFASQPPALAPSDEHLFKLTETRKRFHCDAYFVDLRGPVPGVVSDAAYWHGLFSHQRLSTRWKGMVEVALISPDGDAAAMRRIDVLKGAP